MSDAAKHPIDQSVNPSTSDSPSSPAAGGQAGSRLRWKPQDIAVGAALGAACGVLFWGLNFGYAPLSALLGAILPGLMSMFNAMWYFSGTFALLILRKPGAAVYVNLVGSLIESTIGSQFSIALILISTLLQGLAAEIPFAVTRYRVFNLPTAIVSGALTALVYGCYLMLFYYQGVSFLSPRGIVHMIAELVGGVVFSGVMSWWLYIALAKTGVLERLASGRALSQRQREA